MLHGSGLYSLAVYGAQFASLIVLPINTRYLTAADYGVLDLSQQVSIVLALLMGMNLSESIGYFLTKQLSLRDRACVLGSALFGGLAAGFAVALAGWFLAPDLSRMVFTSPEYAPFLRLVLWCIPLSFMVEVGIAWLRVENRTTQYVKAIALRTSVSVIGTVIGVAALHGQIWGVLGATVLALICAAALLSVYMFRVYSLNFDLGIFRKLVKFSFPLGVGGLGMFIIHFGDRFLLPHYRPLGDLGVYSVAYKLGMMISLAYGCFHLYWSAQIYQIARREDAGLVIARTFSYLMLILTVGALALVFGSIPALRLFTRPAFYGAARLVPVIVLAYYVRGIGDFFRCLFLVEGRPSHDAAVNWIGACACIVGYVTLIPKWGIWGAAIATLIAFSLIGVLSVAWSYHLHPYTVEGARLVKLGIAAAVPLTAYFLMPVKSLPGQIAWTVFLLLSCLGLLLLLRFPTPGEWQLLGSIPARIRVRTGASPAP